MPIKRNDYADRLKDIYTNNRIVGTIIYPTIEKTVSDLYITSRVQDRLDLLANKYYGTTRLWWILAQANQLGEGSFVIQPGTRLRIPQNVGEILDNLEQLNKER